MFSFFVLGPDETLDKRVHKIKTEHERLNPNAKVNVRIISKTTKGCAIGHTQYNYSVEIKEKEL